MIPPDRLPSPEPGRDIVPDASGPTIRRTHYSLWGISLAVDLMVCRPLEWATFPGREDGDWQVQAVGDQVVAWRLVRGLDSRLPPPRRRDHDGPAPPGELATWPLVDREERRVATRVIMARSAWEALPVPERPGGHWSEDGGHLMYDRPA